ncbi:hypothetical protein Trydic_g11210 [Trypoxylus dichotomus]
MSVDMETSSNRTCNICTDSFFQLPVLKNAEAICERGCRLFNIIYLTDGHSINDTKQQCSLSCMEAYINKENERACLTGCYTMGKRKEADLANILTFLQQSSTKNLFLESDIEISESDLLSDPMIKTQLQLGYSLEYKIPETKVKTMPISEIIEQRILESKSQFPGNWLDCASRNSGIPKLILLLGLSFASILVLFLFFRALKVQTELYINETQEVKPEDCESKLKFDQNVCDNEQRTDELAELVENEISFSKPPKYSSNTENV